MIITIDGGSHISELLQTCTMNSRNPSQTPSNPSQLGMKNWRTPQQRQLKIKQPQVVTMPQLRKQAKAKLLQHKVSEAILQNTCSFVNGCSMNFLSSPDPICNSWRQLQVFHIDLGFDQQHPKMHDCNVWSSATVYKVCFNSSSTSWKQLQQQDIIPGMPKTVEQPKEPWKFQESFIGSQSRNAVTFESKNTRGFVLPYISKCHL